MRAALQALTEELRRLKAAGVRAVPVSEEGLDALRRAANASAEAPEAAPLQAGSILPGKPSSAARAAEVQPIPLQASKPALREPSDTHPAPSASPRIPPPPVVPVPDGNGNGDSDQAARLEVIRGRMLSDPVCLSHARPGKKLVFGVGNPGASLLFVGEAPGAEEEDQGEPFVGPAGQLLTRMIAGMGLSRAEVYIANIMKWRPEISGGQGGAQYGNRPPTPEEMAYCLPYLRAQIAVLAPSVIVALGASAAHGLLGQGAFRALHEIRGTWREFDGKPLMVTYHPSFILRNPTNKSKRLIWVDLLKVMESLSLPVSEKQRNYFSERLA